MIARAVMKIKKKRPVKTKLSKPELRIYNKLNGRMTMFMACSLKDLTKTIKKDLEWHIWNNLRAALTKQFANEFANERKDKLLREAYIQFFDKYVPLIVESAREEVVTHILQTLQSTLLAHSQLIQRESDSRQRDNDA